MESFELSELIVDLSFKFFLQFWFLSLFKISEETLGRVETRKVSLKVFFFSDLI